MEISQIMPRFSIIVPLYNKASYVVKTLESIVAQSYNDWECLIVDDGSTDNSRDIVEDYIKTLDVEKLRFVVLSQSNSGVSMARNRGVKESNGEFLCFLDADDWWQNTFLEEIDKLISDYPNAGIYATNYVYYKIGKTHVALNLKRGYIDYPKAYYESEAMPIWTGATCMPQKVFEEMGGFPVGIKLGEDFLLWAQTALNYKIVFCEKPLAYYNNNVPISMRATRNLHEPQHHMLFALNSLENLIEQLCNVSQKEEWKRLLDKLRVSGLMDYWLNERYHEIAEKEISKVDWSHLPPNTVKLYKRPIRLLKIQRRLMQIGSFIKQKCLRYYN